MYKHILLPTDGSERSTRAINAGISLAKELGARVSGIYVGEQSYLPTNTNKLSPRAELALSVVSDTASAANVAYDCVSIRSETPHEGIINFAQNRQCDLIVMGTHGRSRVGKLILGSVAATLLEECDIPVLLYR